MKEGIHPAALLAVTAILSAVTASFPRHSLAPLLPILLYHAVAPPLLGIRTRRILPDLLRLQPLLLLFALPNMLFNGGLAFLFGAPVPAGLLTALSLLLRGNLIVSAVLLAVHACGPEKLLSSLRTFGLPRSLLLQLLLTWRHTATLAEEIGTAVLAYRLRSFQDRGIRPSHWGPFAGSLLLRGLDRAERVHRAMELRGVGQTALPAPVGRPWRISDTLWTLGWNAFFLLARAFDLPLLLGRLAVLAPP